MYIGGNMNSGHNENLDICISINKAGSYFMSFEGKSIKRNLKTSFKNYISFFHIGTLKH